MYINVSFIPKIFIRIINFLTIGLKWKLPRFLSYLLILLTLFGYNVKWFVKKLGWQYLLFVYNNKLKRYNILIQRFVCTITLGKYNIRLQILETFMYNQIKTTNWSDF